MGLSREMMLGRMYASDKNYNGRFLTGVLSTGIYCLPSCNARKPKPENVQFFYSEAEAQRAGLRACRRCRPDGYYQNHDPDLERLIALTARVRQEPSVFADVPDMAQESEIGITKLTALFRQHYHTTPASLLNQARIAQACQQLIGSHTSDRSTLEIAFEVGYESLSAFNENFRKQMSLCPSEYRKLGNSSSFTLALPPFYRAEYVLRNFWRDPKSAMESAEGNRITKVVRLNGQTALLHIELEAEQAVCSVETTSKIDGDALRAAHTIALRLLGLTSDPLLFERKLEGEPELRSLIGERTGLRIPLTGDVFEALVWSIIGQQINLAFAFSLRRTLAEKCGTRYDERYIAHPTPEQVANLKPSDLTPHQFSQRKAEYLIDTARLIVSGELPLADFAKAPVTQVEKCLLAVRGLGPWSVNYILMRGFGCADCVPIGDSGLRTALRKFFAMESSPTPAQTVPLMEAFAPYRSLATYHLWMTLGDPA